MADKHYTIKQLADELNVTKPGIRKLMTTEFRKQYTETVGNRILINNAGARVIRKHFKGYKKETVSQTKTETKENKNYKSETVSDGATNTVISAQEETIRLLKEELRAKNDQLANMQKLLDQDQQLLLNTQAENKILLALTNHDDPDKTKEGEYHESTPHQQAQPNQASQSKSDQDIIDNLNRKKRHWWQWW